MIEYTEQDLEDINRETTSFSTQVNLVYQALANAETKGFKNPWIRTVVSKAPGSTAYGPVQMTASTKSGLITSYRKNKPELFTQPELGLMTFAEQQAQLFLKNGNNKGKVKGYDPRFDYGGEGYLANNPIWKALYMNVAKKIIQDKLEQHGGDMYEFIKDWRGQDPEDEYIKKFNEVYPHKVDKPQQQKETLAPPLKPYTPAPGGIDQRLEFKVGDKVEVDGGYIAEIVGEPSAS